MKDKKSIVGSFTVFDWLFVALVVYTVFSFIVTPRITGGSLSLAKTEIFDTLCMMLLYFPVRFMIKWKQINTAKFERLIYICIFILSVIHIVLYIGQSYNEEFIEGYFDIIYKLSMKTAILPKIILGHAGYPRVIYGTSIFIIMGLYLALKKLPNASKIDYVAMAVHLTALLTTMTKSMWIGMFVGFLFFVILYVIKAIKDGNKNAIKQMVAICLCGLVLTAVLDVAIFKGGVSTRVKNAFITSYDGEHETDKNGNPKEDVDAAGSAESNTIKIEQTKLLLEKWRERPLLGFGYGSYLKDYIRSEEAVFSYEMQAPALLMKTGILGISLCVALVLCIILRMRKYSKDNKINLYAWLMLVIAFGLCIQTNPMLLSFTGISFVLYIVFAYIEQETVFDNSTSRSEVAR